MKLFDATQIPILQKALDGYSRRNRAIASNISNINTPGYKAQSVRFEEELADAMQGSRVGGTLTNPRHMPLVEEDSVGRTAPESSEGTADELASGVNNVDIDHEMAELAKNQIRFKFAAKLLGQTFKGIQQSIRGTV